jgi:hypothetical protein
LQNQPGLPWLPAGELARFLMLEKPDKFNPTLDDALAGLFAGKLVA